jgi:hypothetical protein
MSGIVADQIYAGALGNGGETLILKDGQGTELQKINASSGWPSGDNTTKETMQWNESSWITAKATPKAENSNTTTLPKVTVDEPKTTAGATPAVSSGVSAHSSPLPLSVFSDQQELSLFAGRDRIVPAGGFLPFEARAVDSKGKKMENVSFVWSFGDGLSEGGAQISHAYEYPGNYIVIVNAAIQDFQAVARVNVRVFAPDITISFKSDAISLFNRSRYEMNISGWKLRAGGQSYAFPEDTIIGAKEDIMFSSAVTKLTDVFGGVTLVSPNNKTVAQTGSKMVTSEKGQTTAISAGIAHEAVLQNIKMALDRVATNAEEVRQQLSTTTNLVAPILQKPKRNIASYQYATAVDLVKQSNSSSTDDTSLKTITIKKPHESDGFFTNLWRFFF